MKRLLLPFILFFTIPFDTSCIKEITFNVVINAEHCEFKVPHKKATMGHNYVVNISSIEEGFILEQSVDFFWIKTEKFEPLYPPDPTHPDSGQWFYKNKQLTIRGSYVTSDIDIKITALPIE